MTADDNNCSSCDLLQKTFGVIFFFLLLTRLLAASFSTTDTGQSGQTV